MMGEIYIYIYDDNRETNRFVFQNHIGFTYFKPKYFDLLPFFQQKMLKKAKKTDKIQK